MRSYILTQAVNEELHSLSSWFRANKLSLNIKKTNFMLFSKCQNNLTNCDLQIDDVTIEKVYTSKFLGVGETGAICYRGYLLQWQYFWNGRC